MADFGAWADHDPEAYAWRSDERPQRRHKFTDDELKAHDAAVAAKTRYAAWAEGYDACRAGEQRHNPYRADESNPR